VDLELKSRLVSQRKIFSLFLVDGLIQVGNMSRQNLRDPVSSLIQTESTHSVSVLERRLQMLKAEE